MISQKKKRELFDSLLHHNGAHPHLPKLSEERAAVLFEPTKDALYQLLVRKVKTEESARLKHEAVKRPPAA